MLQNPSSSDWEKSEHLKNVQRYRETTKASILSKVTETVQVQEQMGINVIAGEPNLFEITMTNPFDEKRTFHVEV